MFTEKDFLHCEGRNLVTADGRRVVLRGTNLGGWLHREGWMDGAGACLLPVRYEKKERTAEGVRFTFGEVVRINRLKLPENYEPGENRMEAPVDEESGANCMEVPGEEPGQNRMEEPPNSGAGTFRLETSLDGETWRCVGTGELSGRRESKLDGMRPVPYAPGVNVYDEGCFICGGMLHTDEFFAKELCITGILDGEPFRYGDVDDFHARQILRNRFGDKAAAELLDIYQDAYIQEADIRYLKDLGFNFLRVPIYWQEILDEDGTEVPGAWTHTDWLVDLCRKLEIYVMLDFHGAPGGNTIGSITAGQLDSNEFWTNGEYQRLAGAIWERISGRYREEPTVACYDLINEPCAAPVSYTGIDMEGVTPPDGPVLFFGLPEQMTAPVRRFYEKTIEDIRGRGDRHVLCIQQFLDPELVPLKEGWENVMCQVHCYPGGDFRDHDAVAVSADGYLRVIRQMLDGTNVPLLAGEFNMWGFPDVWEKWMETLNELSVSWANWSYKITDPVNSDNWSLRYDFQGRFVDYVSDSRDVIAQKWGTFGSENYRTNRFLEEILARHAGSEALH